MAGHVCWCGHSRDAHQHYRPGTDCGLCGCTGLDTGMVCLTGAGCGLCFTRRTIEVPRLTEAMLRRMFGAVP
jgi:hypothetical protein